MNLPNLIANLRDTVPELAQSMESIYPLGLNDGQGVELITAHSKVMELMLELGQQTQLLLQKRAVYFEARQDYHLTSPTHYPIP